MSGGCNTSEGSEDLYFNLHFPSGFLLEALLSLRVDLSGKNHCQRNTEGPGFFHSFTLELS